MNLHLHLKSQYFNAIAQGSKLEEYRLCTPYWQRRLENRSYNKIVLKLGYPKRNDMSRTIIRPWHGYTIKTIQHELFGALPVQVYAIWVN